MTFRARIVGSVKRVPGLYDISGYKPAVFLSPGVLVSEKQMRYLIDTYTANNAKAKTAYDELMENQPSNNTHNLPKKQLSVFVQPEVTPLDIARLTNRLVQLAGENNVFAFNVIKFVEDL